MTIVEQIVAREIEAVIVFESNDVIAFADHDPINFGHILICPKRTYESLIDLPDHIYSEINAVARDLYKRIQSKFKPDGITLIQNNGRFNELSHYHLHIFPRFIGDQFAWHSQALGIQPIDKLREMMDLL
ncbi:HIT family protein [Alginatibacterium sediminis]|uniref:HIT family protein n=1 Tax=Alginatibacterium sediminis TaxID=2164068 RepID=A0A420E9T3_9ALTE|nr:HIT family protein [Alginatibacterium sediminis]RKF17435.1 HIT family protein [Alginatibacterium sediminis]